ncbi:hypothetical protein Tco_0400196 [Tanacetum coccineum]
MWWGVDGEGWNWYFLVLSRSGAGEAWAGACDGGGWGGSGCLVGALGCSVARGWAQRLPYGRSTCEILLAVISSALGYPAFTVGTITGTPEVRPSRSSRTRARSSQCSNAHTGYGPNYGIDREIHRPRWDRRIDKGNRDDDRDHTEKQKNSIRFAGGEVGYTVGFGGDEFGAEAVVVRPYGDFEFLGEFGGKNLIG